MDKLPVVIDASLAIYGVLNTPFSEQAAQVLEELHLRQASLFAPELWLFEVTSVIHRYWFDQLIDYQMANQALEILTVQFHVQLVKVDWRPAFDWASRLHQKAAYDGFYLAAAENLSAEFWTADKKLCENAHTLGAGWVHWAGEAL